MQEEKKLHNEEEKILLIIHLFRKFVLSNEHIMRKTLLLLLAILALSACKEKEANQIEYPFDKMYITEFNYVLDERIRYVDNDYITEYEWLYHVSGFSELDSQSSLKFVKYLGGRHNERYYESSTIISDSVAISVIDIIRHYPYDTAFLYTGGARIYDGSSYAFIIQNEENKNIIIKFEPEYLPEDLKWVYDYLYGENTSIKQKIDYDELFEEFEEMTPPTLPPPPILKETIKFEPPVIAKDEEE